MHVIWVDFFFHLGSIIARRMICRHLATESKPTGYVYAMPFEGRIAQLVKKQFDKVVHPEAGTFDGTRPREHPLLKTRCVRNFHFSLTSHPRSCLMAHRLLDGGFCRAHIFLIFRGVVASSGKRPSWPSAQYTVNCLRIFAGDAPKDQRSAFNSNLKFVHRASAPSVKLIWSKSNALNQAPSFSYSAFGKRGSPTTTAQKKIIATVPKNLCAK